MIERQNENFILMLVSLACVGLTAESILMGWEFWVPPLVIIGTVLLWVMNITSKPDYGTRKVGYLIYAMLVAFFHGVHETSFYDVAIVITMIMLAYSIFDHIYMINLIMVEYVIIMGIQLILANNNPEIIIDKLSISRAILHFLAVLFVFFCCKKTINDRIENRDKNKKKDEIIDNYDADMEDFLSNISHELRTPVNVVNGMSDLMIKRNVGQEAYAVKNAGIRLAYQIEDILDYTECKRNKVLLEEDEYMSTSLINDVVTSFRMLDNSNNLELVVDLAPSVPTKMKGDIKKLHKIFRHLMENAVKFTKRGGILVRMYSEKTEYGVNLIIEMNDTGIGMDRRALESISEGMYQVNKKRNRSSGGIGLGLYIVYGFTHRLGGFVKIESEKNTGTTVRVTIPQKVIDEVPCLAVSDSSDGDILFHVRADKYFIPKVREFYRTMATNLATGIHVPLYSAETIGDIERLKKDIRKWRNDDYRIIIVSPSRTRAKRISDSFMEDDLPAFFSESSTRTLLPREVMVTTGNLPEGWVIPESKQVLISEGEIFGKNREGRKKRLPKKYEGEKYKTLDEIGVGDYVVHERHGIGIYKGIEKVKTSDGRIRDYINIDYAGGGKLFIPVEQLSLIGKYSNKDSRPPKLNKLGGETWNKTRSRVKSHIDNLADELIQLYAIRNSKKGYAFSDDTVWQREFEELFPYEETPDQLRAIEDTKADMDFGKTEVAIRAAFKAVQDGKQVAYLVPTTILAEQHYETFNERMKGYPINVRMLSRFCSTKEKKEIIEGLKNGSVDIVIGTHRLLSKDIAYKSLGLLIIDEEQRFGVKHKETIKQLKNTVDVLTLTATPIPRTLHMSLIGIRDMSLLEEPPVDRRPIQTYVMEYDREIVKEAITRELSRGGQVYYVYNRVDDISRITLELREILPDARIEYAHGKMNGRELEDIMHAFIAKEIDVLVSTTIIETGLDIPNVNTIIIHNADNFGLAQLYQLRGRVGRSDRSSYAFLMYRRDKVIREVAEKRLSAIREFTELGSGYKISMKDLEIRGAGNILGSSQSGHMEEIGYDLYVKLLSQAVKKRMGETEDADFDTSVDIPIDAYIPEEYVRNEYLKLELYKRISHIESIEDAEDIMAEVEDRFGKIPKQVSFLLDVALIRAKAHAAYLSHVRYKDGWAYYIIQDTSKYKIEELDRFIKKYKGNMRIVATKESGFMVKTSSLIQENMLKSISETIDDIRSLINEDN